MAHLKESGHEARAPHVRDRSFDRALVALILSTAISKGPYLALYVVQGGKLAAAYDALGLGGREQQQVSAIVSVWLWISLVAGTGLYMLAWWFGSLAIRSWDHSVRVKGWVILVAALGLGVYGAVLSGEAPTVELVP